MAPIRTSQASTRPRRSIQPVNGYYTLKSDLDIMPSTPLDGEPPLKRMRTSRSATSTRSRWIPGGRGGGGRHIDVDAGELPSPTPRTPATVGRPRARRGRPPKHEKKAQPQKTPRTSARSANRANTQRPRYSTAAAAATAATAHGDGYKPREERGWEEFHADLDLDAEFAIIPSAEIDGTVKVDAADDEDAVNGFTKTASGRNTPTKKRGRPSGRRTDSMLKALAIPETPKIVPLPGPNPRERLTLPKPSFRELDPFGVYEEGINYVDKTMASVGYQESELFSRPDRAMIRQTEGSAEEDLDLSPDLLVNVENSAIGSSGVGRVEYDMDEQDVKWLDMLNKTRVADGALPIKPAIFEVTMTKIEKEWHALEKRIPKPNPKAPQTQRPRSSSAAAVNGEPAGEEGDTKCVICDDGDAENANAIVFCDGCDLAVHQECYGVPFIPEGQWLCRKCQLVGNSRPSCIFCPHEGGAFKQTNNAKWPISFAPFGFRKSPLAIRHLWSLSQMSRRFRQAGGSYSAISATKPWELASSAATAAVIVLFISRNTLIEQSALRGFCHQHSPNDWKADHNTDKAYDSTVNYCKNHFKGQVWADSRASALAINEGPAHGTEKGPLKITLPNKRGQKPKTIWKLPSGAPVIPEVILNSIEASLVRFSVNKKKEYVSELCKYWTLKREARRGAALLKRLQLQMDTFSSFEVTRRDYKAQGAAGRARLDRRIEFAETLEKDLERIKALCELVKQREDAKIAEARLLKDVVNIVYFPILPLLDTVLQKAIKHDKESTYRNDLSDLQTRIQSGEFTSITSFSKSFAQIFADRLKSNAATFAEIMQQVSGRRPDDSTPEQTELRAKARNILRACQPLLEDALRKESELTGRPFEQQMKELDEALISRRNSINGPNGISTPDLQDVEMPDADAEGASTEDLNGPKTNGSPKKSGAGPAASTPPASTNGLNISQTNGEVAQPVAEVSISGEPPTPPMSTEGQGAHPSLSSGGIPWYVEAFDPFGTTIYEERWTGQQVLREMSEELSEMDEDELQELGPEDDITMTGLAVGGAVVVGNDDALPNGTANKKSNKSRSRKSNGWSKAGKPRRYR
ncbi:NuA3 HAT complex component NTO1 [Cyphellophora attinorum]|uniref:NuA3 HAT complex component NTO1 n=1 Tax=Cyphellophora attinorum TaxID=1664694 RepID=A0A0N1P358_9EURO|nr:NuA3 HAT complex component NTO1 [Phialophora attinorum]KPI43512.1 NuA3 HAT complex component NTO1 [Phialophora attinorum]